MARVRAIGAGEGALARRLLAGALAVALALGAVAVGGCYRSSSGEEGESAHTETVDDATFTAVRDAIEAEGLVVESRDVLMYRESDTEVRAEAEFRAEDGTSYGTVRVRREGEDWKVVEKE